MGSFEIVRLDTSTGVVSLGPGRADRMTTLEAMIRTRLP
jgi:hypothetical protein